MNEKELVQSIFQDYRDLGISKFKAKECTIIAIRIGLNLAVKSANEQMATYLKECKKQAKNL